MTNLYSNYSNINPIFVDGLWCLHSYYTLCPYAPDGSGRILISGADLKNNTGEVLVVSPEGKILNRFGKGQLHGGFYHTGFWQTWSSDAKFVYYQSGSLTQPKIIKYELATGKEWAIDGDMEGAPPHDEPIVSGLLGMLYAAGYGDGIYKPNEAPVPFQNRKEHGLFSYKFNPNIKETICNVEDILNSHPFKEKLLESEKEIKAVLGENEGLTLMCYCLRWNKDGSRALFYFGNHCVVRERKEPRLAYIFTVDREMRDIHLALDLSYGKRGVHWSWHPDGEHLIGYGPDPDNPDNKGMVLAQVKYDGTDYKCISKHSSGGHPSISPIDYNLLVTDEGTNPGKVVFIDLRTDTVVDSYTLPRVNGETEPYGRNPFRVCHHPVFSADGKKVLVNTLPGDNAVLCEINL